MVVRDDDGSIAAARGEEPPFDGAVLHIMPDGEIVWSDVPADCCPKCGFDECPNGEHPGGETCPAEDSIELNDDDEEGGEDAHRAR